MCAATRRTELHPVRCTAATATRRWRWQTPMPRPRPDLQCCCTTNLDGVRTRKRASPGGTMDPEPAATSSATTTGMVAVVLARPPGLAPLNQQRCARQQMPQPLLLLRKIRPKRGTMILNKGKRKIKVMDRATATATATFFLTAMLAATIGMFSILSSLR